MRKIAALASSKTMGLLFLCTVFFGATEPSIRAADLILPETSAGWFDGSQFGLVNRLFLFRPDASAGSYTACDLGRTQAFEMDPSGGEHLILFDDSFAEVILPEGVVFAFYGQPYDRLYVGSNGYITFGQGDTSAQSTLAHHFAQPRISAFLTDLNPSNPESISYKIEGGQLAVTYENVPLYGDKDNRQSFQIVLDLRDGSIRITWLNCRSSSNVPVGLSRGLGMPEGFSPVDWNGLPGCCGCGDFDGNSLVSLEDMAILAGFWMHECTGPEWCGWSDLDRSGQVDLPDLTGLAQEWELARLEWNEPVLLSELNAGENYARAPALTADERLMVFMRRDPVSGYPRLFEATREEPNGPFTGGRLISELITTGLNIGHPWISPDGLHLYYWEMPVVGNRGIKMAARADRSQPWTYIRDLTELDPTDKGGNAPSLTADELIIVFYSERSGSSKNLSNLWMAERNGIEEPFSGLRPIDEVNSNVYEQEPYISPDGLKLFFNANHRYPTLYDIYEVSRTTRNETFGQAELLSMSINKDSSGEVGTFVTNDGKKLYFERSQGDGPYGIYMSRLVRIIEECLPR
ncbi:MAG: PD40 domain-containing protein [Sedimentisphaerales bacterium]|nr:PD40 domain-containing protein [Sedimentisphaerales bacterium]